MTAHSRKWHCFAAVVVSGGILVLAAPPAGGESTNMSSNDQSAPDARQYEVGGRKIMIGVPGTGWGMVDADTKARLLAMVSPGNNRMIEMFAIAADLRQDGSADTVPKLPRYALAQVSRRAEFVAVSASDFGNVVRQMKQIKGSVPSGLVEAEHVRQLSARTRELLGASSTGNVGCLFDHPSAYVHAEVMRNTWQGKNVPILAGSALVLVGDRLISLYLYAPADTADIEWIHGTMKSWIATVRGVAP